MARRLSWLWGCSLMLATGMGGCIKREPRPEVPESDMAAATATVSPAARPPTGNWGKVQGTDVLGGKGIRAFALAGQAERVTAKFVKVEGEGFSEAIQAEIREKPSNAYDVQIRALNTEPIESGDVLLATVFLRSVTPPKDSEQGESEFVFELSRDPWTKSITQGIRATKDWQKLHIPFIAGQAFGPGEAQIAFRLGFAPQVLEFGAVTVENFRKELALADIPTARPTYSGMAADASWRKDAADRIEKTRKADLAVIVKTADGKPVLGAKVTLRQTRSGFHFGTSAPASDILSEQNPRFREVLRELFTVVAPENDLRWAPLAGDWGSSYTLARATAAAGWLDQEGFGVYGASLISPAWRDLPKGLRTLEKEPDKLRAEIERHIRETVSALRGKIDVWDVVENPAGNRDLLDVLGDKVLGEWLAAARASDPDAKLLISDAAALGSSSADAVKRQRFEGIVRALIDAKAPIDAIGLQARLGSTLVPPEVVVERLDQMAKLGKKLYVSEFDVTLDEPAVRAQYVRDFYTAVFSHPAVDGMVLWGFWDGAHWKNNAPLYGQDWSEKPGAAETRRLLLETWRSNSEGDTAADGTYRTRAFLGNYEVEASAAGKSAKSATSLAGSGAEVVLVLK